MPGAHDLLERAALNNAHWCDSVCAAHGRPGEFQPHIWLQHDGSPPFYPDAVTLSAQEGRSQERHIVALAHARPHAVAVKDSFCRLDLAGHGFEILFDADWIALPFPEADRESPAALSCLQMRSDAELQRWEDNWAGTSAPAGSRIFLPGLLSGPDIRFLLLLADGIPIGGGVLSHAAGVTGLSNVFSQGLPAEAVWKGLVTEAARIYPGLPLVGYESGDDLATARRAGFESIGQLRVWLRR
ncbi:hypothetical protein C7441_107129 [Pseudaminobacter salicylatoxidans]|uniref:N-acetyltransferase domain-containing protein n=1 Tax=Pseudaminobacter salicylatoxidans TaxID=93369 RepID=A0A316C2K7_PSESE|nr:hypothetical protein [Pseudaminobacter salicylatoxidans]PWJ83969.1 hypothetical protein C7441_107129 [Pseudaminobacter salicylatoxidans]